MIAQAFSIRPASHGDVMPIVEMYQGAAVEVMNDPLFLDHRKLGSSLSDKGFQWIVAEAGGKIVGVLAVKRDLEQRIGKIVRLYTDPLADGGRKIQRSLIAAAAEAGRPQLDLLFITTRFISFDQLLLSVEEGFRFLGFFPTSARERTRNPAGVTVRYFDGVLEGKRFQGFPLHPIVAPFFELICDDWTLPPLPAFHPPRVEEALGTGAVELELIEAPNFVRRKYSRLREMDLLSTNFYPFQEPNVLLTDPEGKLEVFAAVNDSFRFASVIVERLEIPVDPSVLYREVARLLHDRNMSYIEMIVDAADCQGIEFMTRAGFVPVVYFPALKMHGNQRRDFVVLGHTYERLLFCVESLRTRFPKFTRVYADLEIRRHLP